MRKFIVAVVVVAIIAASTFGWFQLRNRDLCEPPLENAVAVTPEVMPSTVAVDVTLPFNELSAKASSAAPQSYSSGDQNGPDKCKKIVIRDVCVGTKYNFNATRGPISIGAGPNSTIHIAMPIDISGQGGFRGDGAKILGLDRKDFKAKVEAYADISLSLGSDWCPHTSVNASFDWIDGAQVEIIGGLWVGISGLVQDQLRSQVQRMGEEAASAIKCDDVKNQVKKAWMARSVPILLPGAPAPLNVNIVPASFGFSGLEVTSQSASFSLRMTAETSISDTAVSPTPLALPPMQEIPLTPGALKLSVPIVVSYKDIVGALAAKFVGKPLSTTTPAGPVTVTPEEFRVYPSNNKLVVGVLVKAKLPQRLLDVNGWVYLSAKPVARGTTLSLDDLSYSRSLDNELWNLVSVAFDGTIKAQLANIGTVDLGRPIDQIKEAISTELSKPHDGVAIAIGTPTIGLGRIVPAKDQLSAEGLFNSQAHITLQP